MATFLGRLRSRASSGSNFSSSIARLALAPCSHSPSPSPSPFPSPSPSAPSSAEVSLPTRSTTTSSSAHFFNPRPKISVPLARFFSSSLGEGKFHELANEFLEQLQERVETLGENVDIEGFDTDHAEGVLTVRVGTLGTFVINKQTPNRQIWLSSPVSGPSRFDWDEKTQCWVYQRNGFELLTLLSKDFSELLKTSVKLD